MNALELSSFLTETGFSLLFPFLALIIGGIWGHVGQLRHFKNIEKAELELSDVTLFNTKPKDVLSAEQTMLVQGNVFMSIDYFRFFLGHWRNILGGKVSTFETNLERGRREALIRMRRAAKKQGANGVYNIKIQSMAIGTGKGVEVLAYGTAVKL